jgi:hypothetical protein
MAERERADIRVDIVRFVEEYQPGIVSCEFSDAQGHRHVFVSKVPYFTSESLGAESSYPRSGVIPCEVIERWKDTSAGELVRVSTGTPLDLESTQGLSEFVVMSGQLSSPSFWELFFQHTLLRFLVLPQSQKHRRP